MIEEGLSYRSREIISLIESLRDDLGLDIEVDKAGPRPDHSFVKGDWIRVKGPTNYLHLAVPLRKESNG